MPYSVNAGRHAQDFGWFDNMDAIETIFAKSARHSFFGHPGDRQKVDALDLRHRQLPAASKSQCNFNHIGVRSFILYGAPIVLPLRLAGRAPGFDLGGLGSNPRGAATSNRHRGIAQSVERRFHTPRLPQVRSLLPRPVYCRLSQVGRQRVVPPS
jgi:hypothetical protein